MLVTLFGIASQIALMWLAAVIFTACTIVFYIGVLRKESHNEMMRALFVFLFSMSVSLFLMGSAMYFGNMLLMNVGLFTFLLGSVFMLKFPLTAVKQPLRSILFYGVLILAAALFLFLGLTPKGASIMAPMILWINLGINGLVTGFFIFLVGLRAKERSLKLKAVGGGVGVMTCCVVSEVATLSGALLTSSIFNFLSPIIIVASVLMGKRYATTQEPLVTPSPSVPEQTF